MDKRFLGILAGIVIIFVGIFVLTKGSGTNNSNTPSSNAQPTNHVEGLGQKNVTLVEYGDYQCPVCEVYYPTLKQVAAQFNNEIHFQFRNLPLSPNPHPNAFAAARAAEAASLQNKFWQMHDALYDNQHEWAEASNPQPFFDKYAQALGLNITQFKQDFASGKINNAINADLSTFNKSGQEMATPTFFLDGKYLPNTDVSDPKTGEPSIDRFTIVINAEIAKQAKH